MKKLMYILLFLFPIIGFTQQNWEKCSPLDYMWMNVGNAGFSAGMVSNIRLTFSPSGEPYVAYTDFGNSYKATVMKFDGSSWVNVGNAGFSAGIASYTSLAFSPSGESYVAYEDHGNSYKTTVMKFDGTSWENVGNAGFSSDMAEYINLAFSPSGIPYVAFIDIGNSEKATVMKYDSLYVGIKEQQQSRLSIYPNPAIDKIYIKLSEPLDNVICSVYIYGMNGRELIHQQVKGSRVEIEISSLPGGLYGIRIKNGKVVWYGKFIKR